MDTKKDIHETTIFAMSSTLIPSYISKKNLNVRIVVPVNVCGSDLTVRFSNRFGKKPGIIKHATIALCDVEGNIVSSELTDVTFMGSTEAKIPTGEEIISDTIPFHVKNGTYIALSFLCGGKPTSGNFLGKFVGVKSINKDLCRENYIPDPPLFEKNSKQPPQYFVPYFRALDIKTERKPMVIACLGDSITAQGLWFKPFMRKLYKERNNSVILNYGISGNRLLADGEGFFGKMFGKSALSRLELEILEDKGITHLLCAIGGNDIDLGKYSKDGLDSSPTETEFENGYRRLIEIAHKRNIKVIACSIYPFSYRKNASVKENKRNCFNAIIRNLPVDRFIDLDPLLKNRGGFGYKEGYSCKDGVHLNEKAGREMANYIDINYLGLD